MYSYEKRTMKCDKCGHKFTQTVTSGIIKRFDPNKCPNCGSCRISPSSGLIDLFLDIFK